MNWLLEALRSRKLVWFALGTGALLRVLYALQTPFLEWDADVYRTVAHHLAAGRGYSADGANPDTFWPPLTPCLLAVLYKAGATDLVARIVWAAIGIATVWLAYRFAADSHGPVAGNLAACGVAVYPYNILVAGSTSTETPNILLILLTVWFTCRVLRTGYATDALVAGTGLGLAILNRPTSWAFVLPLALLFLLRPAHMPMRKRVLAVILYILSVGLLAVPWSVRCSRLAGQLCFTTSAAALNLWLANNPWFISHLEGQMSMEELSDRLRAVAPTEGDQRARDRAYLAATKRFFCDTPADALRLLAYKTMAFWQIPGLGATRTSAEVRRWSWLVILVGSVSYIPLLFLRVWAVASKVTKRRSGEIWLYVLYVSWIAITYASSIWFPAVTRYRFAGAVDELMIILAAAFIAERIAQFQVPRSLSDF